MLKKYLTVISYTLCLSTNLFSMEKETENNSFQILFGNAKLSPQVDLSKIVDPALENEDNNKRQLDLIKVAANLGHANAHYALASLYCRGLGVEKNIPLAFEYLKSGEKNSLTHDIEFQYDALTLHYNLLIMMEQDILKDEKPISFSLFNNIQSEKIIKQNKVLIEMNNKINSIISQLKPI